MTQPDNTIDSEVDRIRALDTIQRNIWARINDEVNLRGIKLSIGDAYALGSVIKEVLHPEVKKWAAQEANKARLDELELAVQQYIHTTKSNPENFSEYAHHRIKALTVGKETNNG